MHFLGLTLSSPTGAFKYGPTGQATCDKTTPSEDADLFPELAGCILIMLDEALIWRRVDYTWCPLCDVHIVLLKKIKIKIYMCSVLLMSLMSRSKNLLCTRPSKKNLHVTHMCPTSQIFLDTYPYNNTLICLPLKDDI